MKVFMQGTAAVTAGDTTKNALSGERYERPPFNAFGSLYMAGSALGLVAELNVGGRSICPPSPINANNRIPIVPDDLLITDVECPVGEQIQLTVQNPTGGSLTYFYRMELEYAEQA